MTVYLNPKLVEISFNNLAPTTNGGKKHLERTSALMYFLAFDAAVKKLNCCPLDLDPKTINGKTNRDIMSLEFVKFVLLKKSSDHKVRQVSALGQVELGGPEPEKRISSNFFTVPVKKASESAKAYEYPSRPASLLKIGAIATGLKWGIDYHDNWCSNFPKFLTEMKGRTPFTDLAVFIFRNEPLQEGYGNLRETLSRAMYGRFGGDLAAFWSQRMDMEKVFFKHGDDPFRDNHQDALTESTFSAIGGVSDREALQSLDKAMLIDRVVYLEGLLAAHDIEYQMN